MTRVAEVERISRAQNRKILAGAPAGGYFVAGDQVAADLCRKSFSDFCQEFWSVIHPDEKLIWGWHNEYMCRVKQRAAWRVFHGLPKEYDLLFNVPPGTTKSTVESVMFPAWTWTNMPNARHICSSHTQELVHDLARQCRDVVNSAKYQSFFPGIELREDQRTKGYYVNTRGGFRLSVTVGGKTPTGFHAHFLSSDDPIDPKKSISKAELKAANDFMVNTLSTRKVDKAIAVTTLVMQRLAQDDPSGEWLSRMKGKSGLKYVCLPAEVTPDIRPVGLRKKYKKGLLDPVRMPRSVLEEERAKGNFFYAGQFLQNPVPLGGLMFDTSKLKIERPPPELKFKRIIRSWDNSSIAKGGDFTVGVKIGRTDEVLPRIWVLDVVRGQWDTNDRERRKDRTAQEDGPEVLVVQEQEPGSGGKDTATTTTIRLGMMGFKVETVKPTGDKELRADPFSVQVNAGNVYLAPGPWNEDYIDEMKYFPHSTHDDIVDASSLGFNKLCEPRRRIGALW